MLRHILAAAFAMAPMAAAADPVLGLWKTQPGDEGRFAHVEIYACEAEICGVIRQTFEASGAKIASDSIDRRMIWAMTPNGGGAYSGGKIWAPDRDKTYNSRMALSGDALEVSGCVLGICRAQNWSRVK